MAITDERKHAMPETAPAAAGGNSIEPGQQAIRDLITGLKALGRFAIAFPKWLALALIPWTITSMIYWGFAGALALSGFLLVDATNYFGVNIGSWAYVIIPIGCIVGCYTARDVYGKPGRLGKYVLRRPKPIADYVK